MTDKKNIAITLVVVLLLIMMLLMAQILYFIAHRPNLIDVDIPPKRPVRGTNTNLMVIEFENRLFAVWSSSDREIAPEMDNRTGARLIVARAYDGSAWGDMVMVSTMDNFTLADRPGAVVFNDSLYVFWSEGKNISYSRYQAGVWSPPAFLVAGIAYPVIYVEPVVFNGTIFIIIKMEHSPWGDPIGYMTFDGQHTSDIEIIVSNAQIRNPLEAMAFNGSLFVFWSDFTLPGIKVFDGANWTTPINPITNPFPFADNYENPSAAIFDGVLYVAWVRIRDSADVRELVITTFDGVRWAVPQILFPPEDRWHWVQDVSLFTDGARLELCWVVYNVTDGGHSTARILWSESSGTGWTPKADVTRPPEREGYPGSIILRAFQNRLILFSSFSYRTFDGGLWSEPSSILQ